ncbi:MAG: ABC transporter family substrate-binding protein [Arthrobacter sp.]|uniref:ABC transporter family substrate-binding protein n=1 Tax=Arthrobacter sp. 179 TaxID=3457734 RepID=UPI00265697EC|nr:ABC transporter family substrate-binding protein [Micrococcaceae bacterium]MDN6168750.1 ABC transporter family substrate-binding protein [Micrococcaceae bacterium]
MRFTRISKAVAIGATAALALSACAASTGTNDSSSGADEGEGNGGEIRVVEVNAFSSFNDNTAKGNVDINSKIAYTTQSDFNYIDNDLKVQKNEKFGKYEVESEDPLTVKYTINEGVKWSDGEPVNADDMMMAWAISSGHFNDAKTDDEGEVTAGTNYFDYAGDTSGLALTDVPEIGDDNRSITLKYSKPFADWETSFGMMGPAHVVADKAGMTVDELTELFKTADKGDPENPSKKPNKKLKKAADFWNTGFDTKSLPDDESLYLSSGPFIVDKIVPDQSMTLVRNEDYDWGPEPKVDSIVVRYISESPAQVQALKNQEVDIIAPQASADTLESLEALGDQVVVEKGDQLSYDHIDLNYNGVFKDKDVRKAFMHTIPRQQIVDTIIKKLNPDAKPLDSQLFVPDNDGYEESAKNNGSADYQKADIEKAKELLDGKKPKVRIMYSKDNPNRADAYSLIAASAKKAGFKVVDGGLGASEWGSALGGGTYDATIFGWISSGVGVTGVPQIFGTGSSSNFNKFSDKKADELMDELIVTTDEKKQTDLQIQIDKLIWDSGYGLPLFQSVGVDAYDSGVEGVEYMSNQTGVWWNFWDWNLKK